MHKSSGSNKTSHHGSRTSALGTNPPFSIDQILSSSSAPMKRAASIHQAMSSASVGASDHQAFRQNHQQHQQHMHHLNQKQQQQQAAAMLMLNQAAGGAHQTPAGSAPPATFQAPGSANIMNSAAMLNEQLALLVAAQQQQQQQQQHGQRHLLKPNALAMAAAQQHLHQQWQQQQLMVAAAAALGQQGVDPSSLGALGPALSSLASQQQQQNNTSPSHLLSCFMASMLLQQQHQQQQQAQHKQLEQHQHRLIEHQHRRNAAPGGCSNATPFSHQREQHAKLAAHFNAIATAAAADHNRSPPSSMISSSSINDTNRPVKRFFSGDLLDCPARPATNNTGLHQSANNQHEPTRRDSISPPPPVRDACANAQAQSQSNKSKSQGRASGEFSPRAAHSYIGLIAMCILSTPEKRMVLNDIYQFILDHYPYYRNRGSGWRNSVRHNLSLNECFQKDIRAPNGKGHYWRIHPANMADFMNGDFRRRRAQRQVRRYNNMEVPSDESDDESMVDATRPPLPEHFKRSLEMHKQLEIIYGGSGGVGGGGCSSGGHQIRAPECLGPPPPPPSQADFMSVAAMAAMAAQGHAAPSLPPPPPPLGASANSNEQNIDSGSDRPSKPPSPHEDSLLFGR